jgi:hypothetical protein
MPERAEIEAMARELRAIVRDSFDTPAGRSDEFFRERAEKILDRVCDARGDDEAEGLRIALKRIAYGLEGEMGRYDAPRDDTWWGRIALEALARFPQGEDHEALDPPLSDRERKAIEDMRAAVRIIGGEEPVPYDIRGMAAEVNRLRAVIARRSYVEQGEDHGPEPDALGGLPPSQPKEDQ